MAIGTGTAILGSAAIGGLAGLLGGDPDNITTEAEPWSGIRPYMKGGGPIPGWVTHTPNVSGKFADWANRLRNGEANSWNQSMPQMFYTPGMGEGTTGWNPYAGMGVQDSLYNPFAMQNVPFESMFGAAPEEMAAGQEMAPDQGLGLVFDSSPMSNHFLIGSNLGMSHDDWGGA